MDEFEQWQEEQQMASPTKGGGAGEGMLYLSLVPSDYLLVPC